MPFGEAAGARSSAPGGALLRGSPRRAQETQPGTTRCPHGAPWRSFSRNCHCGLTDPEPGPPASSARPAGTRCASPALLRCWGLRGFRVRVLAAPRALRSDTVQQEKRVRLCRDRAMQKPPGRNTEITGARRRLAPRLQPRPSAMAGKLFSGSLRAANLARARQRRRWLHAGGGLQVAPRGRAGVQVVEVHQVLAHNAPVRRARGRACGCASGGGGAARRQPLPQRLRRSADTRQVEQRASTCAFTSSKTSIGCVHDTPCRCANGRPGSTSAATPFARAARRCNSTRIRLGAYVCLSCQRVYVHTSAWQALTG